MTLMTPLMTTLLFATPASAQSMDKKTHVVEVTRDVTHDADAVWDVLGPQYAEIWRSSPDILFSEFDEGSTVAELGAVRYCYFNEKHTKLLHEEIVGWDPESRVVDIRILDASGFPVDPDNSLGTFGVEPLPEGGSRITARFEYRTKPAMLGGIAKGAFTKSLDAYLLAVDLYIETGEDITAERFAKLEQR